MTGLVALNPSLWATLHWHISRIIFSVTNKTLWREIKNTYVNNEKNIADKNVTFNAVKYRADLYIKLSIFKSTENITTYLNWTLNFADYQRLLIFDYYFNGVRNTWVNFVKVLIHYMLHAGTYYIILPCNDFAFVDEQEHLFQ